VTVVNRVVSVVAELELAAAVDDAVTVVDSTG
jgi:hypothetical protein